MTKQSFRTKLDNFIGLAFLLLRVLVVHWTLSSASEIGVFRYWRIRAESSYDAMRRRCGHFLADLTVNQYQTAISRTVASV